MNPPGYQATIKTVQEFWLISAPITIALIVLMSIFLFRPDSQIKQWMEQGLSDKFTRLVNTGYRRLLALLGLGAAAPSAALLPSPSAALLPAPTAALPAAPAVAPAAADPGQMV